MKNENRSLIVMKINVTSTGKWVRPVYTILHIWPCFGFFGVVEHQQYHNSSTSSFSFGFCYHPNLRVRSSPLLYPVRGPTTPSVSGLWYLSFINVIAPSRISLQTSLESDTTSLNVSFMRSSFLKSELFISAAGFAKHSAWIDVLSIFVILFAFSSSLVVLDELWEESMLFEPALLIAPVLFKPLLLQVSICWLVPGCTEMKRC